MANDVTMKIDGLATFAKQCRRIGKEAQAELRKTNLHAAQLVVPEAQHRAPKGPHEGGGIVQPISASIRAVAGQRYAAVRAGGKRTPHAAPREFGGTLRRHASSKKTSVPATPYVFPGVAAMVPRITPLYQRDFGKLIRQAFPF